MIKPIAIMLFLLVPVVPWLFFVQYLFMRFGLSSAMALAIYLAGPACMAWLWITVLNWNTGVAVTPDKGTPR